jgi:uncharacterized membrane protein
MAPNDTKLTQAQITTSVSFSGPLPHPEFLARYNDVVPNGAERIMKMAEDQQGHRMSIEKTVIEGNVKSERRGQWMGLTVSVLVLCFGSFLAYSGHQITGGVFVTVDIIGLASVFVIGKRAQSQELARKREPFKKHGK